VKTLKELLAAINALPVTAFGDDRTLDIVHARMKERRSEWFRTDEPRKQNEQEEAKLQDRRHLDAQRFAQRERQVRKWLKDGTLTKGTFIKVTGARDGYGIREVVEIKTDRLVCRQWLPFNRCTYGDAIKMDGKSFSPQAQMTEHDFNKVAKILG
jgi:hypothetical protein